MVEHCIIVSAVEGTKIEKSVQSILLDGMKSIITAEIPSLDWCCIETILLVQKGEQRGKSIAEERIVALEQMYCAAPGT